MTGIESSGNYPNPRSVYHSSAAAVGWFSAKSLDMIRYHCDVMKQQITRLVRTAYDRDVTRHACIQMMLLSEWREKLQQHLLN